MATALIEHGTIVDSTGKSAFSVSAPIDPRTITDNPGGDRQAAGRPEGIRRVLLNGKTVVIDGRYVEGVRPGRVLKA